MENIDFIRDFHPPLFDHIQTLHSKLALDASFQVKLDCFLPVCSFILQKFPLLRPSKYEHFVLNVHDAPQLGNMPDIGHVMRDCVMHAMWGNTLLGQMLHVCFPCPKPLLKPIPNPNDYSAPIILNIVFGFLLGLYPDTTKKPHFLIRAHIFTRIHILLTMDMTQQTEWVRSHTFLCYLALCEYISKVLPVFFPVEYDAVVSNFPVKAFFTETHFFYDAFRQEHLDNGDESWDIWNDKAKSLYDKLHRVYKSKCRCRTILYKRYHSMRNHVPPLVYSEIANQLRFPVIHLYPYHDEYPKQTVNEYQTLGCMISNHSLSKFISVHTLPANIQLEQLRLYEQQANCCQQLALMRRTLSLCLYCEYKNKHSNLRISVLDQSLLCEECQSGACVISMDTLGRVLQIYDKQFLYSTCCGRVVMYSTSHTCYKRKKNEYNTVTSEDLINFLGKKIMEEYLMLPHTLCPHDRPVMMRGKTASAQRVNCTFCKAEAMENTFELFDLERRSMRECFCCVRHAPRAEQMKRLKTFQDFERYFADPDRVSTTYVSSNYRHRRRF